MAFIVLKENGTEIQSIHKEIEDLCISYIPERERPKWYRYVKEIPYNLAGKVDLIKLKETGLTENLNEVIMDKRKG